MILVYLIRAGTIPMRARNRIARLEEWGPGWPAGTAAERPSGLVRGHDVASPRPVDRMDLIMNISARMVAVTALLIAPAAAQSDDFAREGKDRELKDRLEGQLPPALHANRWMNTDGKDLELSSLHGKVVLIDFWGTW